MGLVLQERPFMGISPALFGCMILRCDKLVKGLLKIRLGQIVLLMLDGQYHAKVQKKAVQASQLGKAVD